MSLSIFYAKHIFMRIASEEEIIRIMYSSDGKNDYAIITLILSSGLSSKFIENMTYKQLLDACDHYFRYNERSISNLIRKNPLNDNFIACFDIGTESRPRMTCCSPEALQLIIEYLRYRRHSENDSDYVFLNSNHESIADKDHISNMFRRAREKANRYLPEGESLDTKSQHVRNRFNYICENHLQGEYRDKVLTLMKGSKSRDNKNFYGYMKQNRIQFIWHYMTVVEYLTLSHSGNDNLSMGNYRINYL